VIPEWTSLGVGGRPLLYYPSIYAHLLLVLLMGQGGSEHIYIYIETSDRKDGTSLAGP
jgi:hypothetical protein